MFKSFVELRISLVVAGTRMEGRMVYQWEDSAVNTAVIQWPCTEVAIVKMWTMAAKVSVRVGLLRH